jgi:hypothetical protein
MIEEILPGLAQWGAYHDGIGRLVHSTFVLESGTLIDPMEPEDGLEVVAALATPRRIVLTNRHHYRHSDRYVERFGCPVLCHEAGIGHFAGDPHLRAFAGDPHLSALAQNPHLCTFSFDEQLAPDVRALELGSICAEETTFLIGVADGVLCLGDGVTRERDGSLAFMPNELLGDDADGVRAGLARNLRRVFEEDFDALLFAHAEPVLSGGRALLSDLLLRAPAAYAFWRPSVFPRSRGKAFVRGLESSNTGY